MQCFTNSIEALNLHDTAVDTLWESFKTNLEAGIEQFILHWQTGEREDVPWLSREIKRTIRKRDRLENIKN